MLDNMTGEEWATLTEYEREKLRNKAGMSPQLAEFVGYVVEVQDHSDATPRRFRVGRSNGWTPIHIEMRAAPRMIAGTPARLGYFSVRLIADNRGTIR